MSILKQASLLMIPSGYKEDKLYSILPSDGSGDLSFARSSTGTRVNSDGFIETVPLNLLNYSELFSNTSWSKLRSTITPNAATSPIGDLTGSELDIGANGYLYKLGVSVVPNTEYTLSFYIQDINSSNNTLAIYDESNASFISIDIPYSVTNQWTRVTHTFTTPTGCTSARPYIQRGVGGSGSVYIWGAQLNAGSTAKTYFPTTDRLNYPRIDYTGGGCGKLLIEPQSTNLVTQSQAFSNAYWTKSGSSVTSGFISPDGTTNAFKLTENSVNDIHVIYNASPIAASATSTASVFYKKGTRRYFSLKIQIGSNSYTQVFDSEGLTTGGNSSNGLTNVVTKIEDYGNGWVRASVSGTSASGTSTYVIIGLSNSLNPTFHPNNYNPTYQGSGTDYGYAYGAQVEQGEYASSYIPTSGTTVTRTQDTSLTTSSNIAAAINDAEGVLFIDFDRLGLDYEDSFIGLYHSPNSYDNHIRIVYRKDRIITILRNRFGYQVLMSYYGTWTMPRIKVAFKYKVDDFALWVNGVEGVTDTSGSTFDIYRELDTINLGDQFLRPSQSGPKFNARINAIAVYDTALSDADLTELTTL